MHQTRCLVRVGQITGHEFFTAQPGENWVADIADGTGGGPMYLKTFSLPKTSNLPDVATAVQRQLESDGWEPVGKWRGLGDANGTCCELTVTPTAEAQPLFTITEEPTGAWAWLRKAIGKPLSPHRNRIFYNS